MEKDRSAADIPKIMMVQKSAKKAIRDDEPIGEEIKEVKLELKHNERD